MSFLTGDDFSARKESEKLIQAELNHLRKQMIEELKRLAEELKKEVRHKVRQGYTVYGRYVSSPAKEGRLAKSLLGQRDETTRTAHEIALSRLCDIEVALVASVFDKSLDMQHGNHYQLEVPKFKDTIFSWTTSHWGDTDSVPPDQIHSGVGVSLVIKFTPPL